MPDLFTEPVLLVAGNVGALLWGAATLKSAVAELERTTRRLDSTLQEIAVTVHRHSAEIAAMQAYGMATRRLMVTEDGE